MRRVVVTGMGIVSSIGNNAEEVVASLREARSGIVAAEDYAELGFRSQVHGSLKIDLDAAVDRRARRFMGDGAGYAWVAMNQAIHDAGLEPKRCLQSRTGLIVGSGGPSTKAIVAAADTTRAKRPQARRALRRAQGDVVHLLGQSVDLVQDQGRQLFDLARPARPRPTASAMRPR